MFLTIVFQKRELELSTKRRDGFLARTNRADLAVEVLESSTKTDYRVWLQHFISGKPAYLYDENNADWLPSINLGHLKKFRSQGKDDARYERAKRSRTEKEKR